MSGELNDFTRQTRDFLLIVVFLTPLQAAGEEYFFRGYLAQAFGGFFSHFNETAAKILAVVIPSILFALAHGVGQSVPIFFDRLAFGLVAGTLVILTGGLEAGIAMHVLNNLLAFGLALAYGDIASSLNPSGGSWWSIPVTLTQSLVYLGLAVSWPGGWACRAPPTRPFWPPPEGLCIVSPRLRREVPLVVRTPCQTGFRPSSPQVWMPRWGMV